MNQVFNGQSLLELQLDTKYALSTATNPKVLYKKPDGTEGSWIGTIVGTIIKYQLGNNDIDMAGIWQFQAYFEISGRKAFGTIRPVEFTKNLLS